jgi:hypothetical protein
VGFNAARFAKIAICILLALGAGFAGSLYLGAKLFAPVDEAAKLETRSTQSLGKQPSSVVPPMPRERADVPTYKDVEPHSSAVTPHQPASSVELPDAKHQATEPARNRSGRDERVGNAESELRLGQQERRRLRAERRRNLENANAGQNKRLKKLPREDTRDEPFFPFRF